MVTPSPGGESFWAAMALKSNDAINNKVWERSPDLGLSLHGGSMLTKVFDVGGQQSMVDDLNAPLPWVTDLVGEDANDTDAILVCGSSVAPFIKALALRGNGSEMKLFDYVEAQSSKSFQEHFMRQVVAPDYTYYGKLATMFAGYAHPSALILFDLCRASFYWRGTRPVPGTDPGDYYDRGGDKVACANPAAFRSYAECDEADGWNWRRVEECRGDRIVALGMLAEHGLLRLFQRHGATAIHRRRHADSRWRFRQDEDWPKNRPAHTGFRISDWLGRDDWWVIHQRERTWRLLPVPHPAYVFSPAAEYGPVRRTLELMRTGYQQHGAVACPLCACSRPGR